MYVNIDSENGKRQKIKKHFISLTTLHYNVLIPLRRTTYTVQTANHDVPVARYYKVWESSMIGLFLAYLRGDDVAQTRKLDDGHLCGVG